MVARPVGHGEILMAVFIVVPDGHREGLVACFVGLGHGEKTAPVPIEDRQVVAILIRHDQVFVVVPVEIPRQYRVGAVADKADRDGLEGAGA